MTYTFSVETEFINDKRGGWRAECTATRSDGVSCDRVVVTGYSSEVNAVERVVGKTVSTLNAAAKKEKAG